MKRTVDREGKEVFTIDYCVVFLLSVLPPLFVIVVLWGRKENEVGGREEKRPVRERKLNLDLVSS